MAISALRVRGRQVRLARWSRTLLDGIPLFAMVPLWVWWATWKGGYPPAVFLAGVTYLAVVSIALCLAYPRAQPGRASAVAGVAAGFLAVWTLASLLWADDKGAAEVASARQIVFLGSLTIPIVWPVSVRALAGGLGIVPLLASCAAVSALVAALGNPAGLVDGRLSDPTGYPNASGGLFAIGMLVAVIVASRREACVPARAGGLASAGICFGACLLTQSRGSMLALGITLALTFVLMADRRRLLIALLILTVCLLPTVSPLLDVHRVAVAGGDLGESVRHAVRVLAFTGVGLLAIGTLYAAIDRRAEISDRVSRAFSVVLSVAASLAVVGGVGLLLVTGADVGGWISNQVEEAKTPDYGRLESEPTRFTGGLGSNRFDYWRASLGIFADRPITGVGAENFLSPYLERRHATTAPKYAHSLWLGTLAELGAVGFLALVAFLAMLAAALARAALRLGRRRWIVVAASLPLLFVLVHGSFDWITKFPVLLAPSLALAGAASAARPALAWGRAPASSRWPAGALVVTLVAFAVLTAPLLLAARLADRGLAGWADRPAGAVSDLRRAASLDPLSSTPDVRLGVVELELGNARAAAAAFEDAVARDESAWYPWFQLGLIAAADGKDATAAANLRRAFELNPREPAVSTALRRFDAGAAPSPRAAQRRVLEAP